MIEDEHGASPEVVAALEKVIGSATSRKRTCSVKSDKPKQKQVQSG